MCIKRRFGRSGRWITRRQSRFWASRIGKQFSKRDGFTLIELLMVIAIITLLMAILLPALKRVKNQTRAVVCQTNLKQWGTILDIYVEENRGRLPSSSESELFFRGTFISEDDPNVPGPLNPFDTKGIACCPMAVKPSGHGFLGTTFEAWEEKHYGPPFWSSYGFNGQLQRVISVEPVTGELLGFDVFSLKGRGKYPVLLDCKRAHSRVKDYEGPPQTDSVRSWTEWGSFCMDRHNGYINGVFLDWSVRKIGLKELWTLKWYKDFDTANPWTKAGGVQPEDWPEWMRGFKDY